MPCSGRDGPRAKERCASVMCRRSPRNCSSWRTGVTAPRGERAALPDGRVAGSPAAACSKAIPSPCAGSTPRVLQESSGFCTSPLIPLRPIDPQPRTAPRNPRAETLEHGPKADCDAHFVRSVPPPVLSGPNGRIPTAGAVQLNTLGTEYRAAIFVTCAERPASTLFHGLVALTSGWLVVPEKLRGVRRLGSDLAPDRMCGSNFRAADSSPFRAFPCRRNAFGQVRHGDRTVHCNRGRRGTGVAAAVAR